MISRDCETVISQNILLFNRMSAYNVSVHLHMMTIVYPFITSALAQILHSLRHRRVSAHRCLGPRPNFHCIFKAWNGPLQWNRSYVQRSDSKSCRARGSRFNRHHYYRKNTSVVFFYRLLHNRSTPWTKSRTIIWMHWLHQNLRVMACREPRLSPNKSIHTEVSPEYGELGIR